MREIIKNVKYIEKFDIDIINKLNIGIEIQDFTEPNLTDEDKKILIKTYKESLKGFENTIALHGPFLDLKPASPDNLIREVSQKKYIETLEYAKELKAEYVIFHSQINPRINKDSLNELINSQTKDAFEYILKESGYKGYIVIENIFEYEPILLLNLVKFIDNEQIGINLDVGHTRLTDCDLEKWISEMKDYIKYMHIHTNNRVYDTHSIPSQKEVDEIYNLLDKYEINPKICLEYEVDDLENEVKKYKRYIK